MMAATTADLEDGAADEDAARRVARLAWLDCADGATRRELACEGHRPSAGSGGCPYGEGVCPHHADYAFRHCA